MSLARLARTARGALALTLAVSSANAAIILFSGADPDANATDPRPNSNAAAASFDAAGTETILTLESQPLGSFTNLALGSGVTINGSDDGGNPQTIRNTLVNTPGSLFGYNTTAGGTQWISVFGGSLTFNFATPIQDFGAYFSGVQLNGLTISF